MAISDSMTLVEFMAELVATEPSMDGAPAEGTDGRALAQTSYDTVFDQVQPMLLSLTYDPILAEEMLTGSTRSEIRCQVP